MVNYFYLLDYNFFNFCLILVPSGLSGGNSLRYDGAFIVGIVYYQNSITNVKKFTYKYAFSPYFVVDFALIRFFLFRYDFVHVPYVEAIGQGPSVQVPGGLSQRSWYGIRVIFLVVGMPNQLRKLAQVVADKYLVGTLGVFDFPTLLTALVNGLVLLKVATVVADALLLYFLPLRSIYTYAT